MTKDHKSYLWLGLAIIAFFLSMGKWNIPVMVWLAPVFVIRFLQSHKKLKGYLILTVLAIFPAFIALKGMVPMPVPEFTVTIIIGSFLSFLPFLLNRWFEEKNDSFIATLFFPSLMVSFELLNTASNPFGTWNSVAYTQISNLAMFQISSIIGIWGIIFIIYWTASVFCWFWAKDFDFENYKTPIIVFFAILLIIPVIGQLRIITDQPPQTVRVSALTSPVSLEIRKLMIDPLITGDIELKELEWEKILIAGQKVGEDLLSRTARVAANGSKIILWSEAAVHLKAEEEKSFIEKAAALARNQKIYLGITLYTYRHLQAEKLPEEKMVENKLLLLKPDGSVAWTYLKVIPVPGMEELMTVKGERKIPFTDTEYGRLGGAICFDMDFPDYLAAAGKNNIDIMLVPGADWQEITPSHTYMASARAIENGFSLLRAVQSGFSGAFDYFGRLQAGMNYFTTANYELHADLPVKGKKTRYYLTGKIFAYSCVLLVLIFLITTFKKKKKVNDAI